MRNKGEALPEGWLVNNKGLPSDDPNDLYTTPGGAILPLGGAQGYKGFGLSLMVQIMGGFLGEPCWKEEGLESHSNLLWLLAIDISAFVAPEDFRREVDDFIRYLRSSKPAQGFDGIIMPGELNFREMEKRKAEGIPLEEETWRQIEQTAKELSVNI
jgi:uncharacterized oxidoreductase